VTIALKCFEKEKLGNLQFYFSKVPLHQQKFLVPWFFLIRLGCRKICKNVQNETTKLFSVGNTEANILALTADSKNKIHLSSDNFVKLRTQSSLDWSKNIFVLPIKKRLVVSFLTFFQISWQSKRIKKIETTKFFC